MTDDDDGTDETDVILRRAWDWKYYRWEDFVEWYGEDFAVDAWEAAGPLVAENGTQTDPPVQAQPVQAPPQPQPVQEPPQPQPVQASPTRRETQLTNRLNAATAAAFSAFAKPSPPPTPPPPPAHTLPTQTPPPPTPPRERMPTPLTSPTGLYHDRLEPRPPFKAPPPHLASSDCLEPRPPFKAPPPDLASSCGLALSPKPPPVLLKGKCVQTRRPKAPPPIYENADPPKASPSTSPPLKAALPKAPPSFDQDLTQCGNPSWDDEGVEWIAAWLQQNPMLQQMRML